jgi:3',5'-cyclic AMP phosphodiesterase CpdA
MTVRVTQLSDTHFVADGMPAEGGGAYDTDAAFDAVFEHHQLNTHADLVVVTGDIADHGLPDEYRKAGDAFGRFDAPVNVCPGNHDLDASYGAGVGRPGVSTSRVIEVGDWAFLFVDSCAGLMTTGTDGRLVDPPGDARLHTNGGLGEREAAWTQYAHDAVRSAHVFVWLHHPPPPTIPLTDDPDYAAEWNALLPRLPKVRGFGGGHTHVPAAYEIDGRPVYVSPSLKNNFSLEPQTWLPPGYRTYEFDDDGSVRSEIRLIDDERWPRRPFGRLLRSLFDGEIGHAELDEIIARRHSDG